MTFTDLKTEILSRAKRQEIRVGYVLAVLSTTRTELLDIAITKNIIPCSYSQGVIDDTLINEFTDGELNAYGIYRTAAGTISNPPFAEIYFFGTNEFDLELSGDGTEISIHVFSSCTLNLAVSDNVQLNIKLYNNAVLNLEIGNSSACYLECIDNSQAVVTISQTCVIHCNTMDKATLNYTGNDSSFGLIKAYNNSVVTYQLNDTAEAELNKYQYATITNAAP